MRIDAVQMVGIDMGAPVRANGNYHYTITVNLAMMTLIDNRLEFIDGDALRAAITGGWKPSIRVDLAIPETQHGGSPSLNDMGQLILGASAQAVMAAQDQFINKYIVNGLSETEVPVIVAPTTPLIESPIINEDEVVLPGEH